MTTADRPDPNGLSPSPWVPYALVGLGLPLGLLVVQFAPFRPPLLNLLVGGALLAVAVGSVTYLVARHSGPGERGPDF